MVSSFVDYSVFSQVVYCLNTSVMVLQYIEMLNIQLNSPLTLLTVQSLAQSHIPSVNCLVVTSTHHRPEMRMPYVGKFTTQPHILDVQFFTLIFALPLLIVQHLAQYLTFLVAVCLTISWLFTYFFGICLAYTGFCLACVITMYSYI